MGRTMQRDYKRTCVRVDNEAYLQIKTLLDNTGYTFSQFVEAICNTVGEKPSLVFNILEISAKKALEEFNNECISKQISL